jgi:hypothetical protein
MWIWSKCWMELWGKFRHLLQYPLHDGVKLITV